MPLRAKTYSTLASLALLAGIAACSAEFAPAGLSRDDGLEYGAVRPVVQVEAAVPGQVVAVEFQNTVAEEFWFNPCERFTERKVDGVWIRLPSELRLCNSMAYILRPYSTREEGVDVPNDLPAGTYRFVFVMRPPRNVEVAHHPASTSFEVR